MVFFVPTSDEFKEMFSKDSLYEIMAGAIAQYSDEFVSPGDFSLLGKHQVSEKVYKKIANLAFLYLHQTADYQYRMEYFGKIIDVLRKGKAFRG